MSQYVWGFESIQSLTICVFFPGPAQNNNTEATEEERMHISLGKYNVCGV